MRQQVGRFGGTSFGHQVPLVIKNPAEFLEPAAERLPGLKPG